MHNVFAFYNKIYIPFPDRGQNVVRKIAATGTAAIFGPMHIIYSITQGGYLYYTMFGGSFLITILRLPVRQSMCLLRHHGFRSL